MSEAGPIRRIVIPVVCLGLTALGLMNVYGDASDAERLAEEAVCGKVGCAARRIEAQRTPFSHKYVYQLSNESMKTGTAECSREYTLVGAYHCVAK